ncbi:hypothetical protein N692_14360 [Lactiplantibacillus plantarum EGD-AQ4]|nr:hypothetical protein N692_14360 [Lactiplantibacillus plantarum EGD-AQ4]
MNKWGITRKTIRKLSPVDKLKLMVVVSMCITLTAFLCVLITISQLLQMNEDTD